MAVICLSVRGASSGERESKAGIREFFRTTSVVWLGKSSFKFYYRNEVDGGYDV